MSSLSFPTLKGFDIEVQRTTTYSTLIQSGASGKELRASFTSTPRYAYELKLNFVRQSGFSAKTLVDELNQLHSFFDTMKGAWDSFNFTDPVDGTVRACRFVDDTLTFKRMMALAWDGGTINLISVK